MKVFVVYDSEYCNIVVAEDEKHARQILAETAARASDLPNTYGIDGYSGEVVCIDPSEPGHRITMRTSFCFTDVFVTKNGQVVNLYAPETEE